MSLEESKALVRRFTEEVNRRNIAIVDELFAPDYVDHTNKLRGREDLKRFYTKIFKDFPDFHRILEDIIAERDKVWGCFIGTGTATSGKRFELTTVLILRIANGKVVEGWTVPKITGELYEKLL